jgi:hypothetical protein
MAANEIGRWPGEICHIKPQRGTPEALEGNIQKLYRDFYSLSSICSRLSFPLTASDLASWVINLSQRRMARQKLRGTNFDRY